MAPPAIRVSVVSAVEAAEECGGEEPGALASFAGEDTRAFLGAGEDEPLSIVDGLFIGVVAAPASLPCTGRIVIVALVYVGGRLCETI